MSKRQAVSYDFQLNLEAGLELPESGATHMCLEGCRCVELAVM